VFLLIIGIVVFIPVEYFFSAVRFSKPVKRRHILCDLNPSRDCQIIFQYLGLRFIKRFHDTGSF
jgi:hypothetical protein